MTLENEGQMASPQDMAKRQQQDGFRKKQPETIDVIKTDYDYGEFVDSLPRVSEETMMDILSIDEESEQYRKNDLLIRGLLKKSKNKSVPYLGSPNKKIGQRSKEKLDGILHELIERSVYSLPVEEGVEQAFIYRRHAELMRDWKASAMRMLDGKYGASSSEDELADIRNVVQFLTLEQKKAGWIETELYPEMFARAVSAARGEVMQFLLEQKNSIDAAFEEFPEIRETEVFFSDPINFVMDGDEIASETAGFYDSTTNSITLKIPTYYDMRDEWRVYMAATHEFVHAVSDQSSVGKVGLRSGEVGRELNEAVTEIVTYYIASRHKEGVKTPLNNQYRERLDIENSGYADYIEVTQRYFEKIPVQKFIDALLTPTGYETLPQAFKDAFGSEYALINLGITLQKLRTAPSERKM